MSIDELRPISPERLRRVRWKGKRAYRILSHACSVRWNLGFNVEPLDEMWRGFEVPWDEYTVRNSGTQDGVVAYSLVDLGPRDPRRYRLLVNDEESISARRPNDLLNHVLWHMSRMPEQTEDFLLIHAGSVVTSAEEGVLLPADSGSGKTTLVAALIRAGFGFLSDEIGVIDHHAGLLRPYPRALNFKRGSERLFPDLWPPDEARTVPRGEGYLRADAIRPDVMAGSSELRFVIFPRYAEGAATEVAPLGAAHTLEGLFANTLNRKAYGGRRALPDLADVVREAKSYTIVSGDVQEAVQALKEITGQT